MPDKFKEKRNRLAERILRLPRIKAAFDDAWYLHCRMFGPIMEPAFVNESTARLQLVSALNLISRGEAFSGMKRLDRLYGYCRTDDDLAAWNFFMGLCFEKMGFRDRAAVLFSEAVQREPEFYMVYLMFAKCLHEEKHYEAALSNYIQALERVINSPQRDEVPAVKPEPLIGSIHGNMAACLIMMRHYDEAEYELYEAESVNFSPPFLDLSWAMLYAATDRRQLARKKMAAMRKTMPEVEAKYALTVEEILAKKNPRFALQKPELGVLGRFWDWFSGEQERFSDAFKSGEGLPGFGALEDKLREMFYQNGETVRFALSRDGSKTCISFFDNYNLTYEIWLDKLIELAPRELRDRWSFYAVH